MSVFDFLHQYPIKKGSFYSHVEWGIAYLSKVGPNGQLPKHCGTPVAVGACTMSVHVLLRMLVYSSYRQLINDILVSDWHLNICVKTFIDHK